MCGCFAPGVDGDRGRERPMDSPTIYPRFKNDDFPWKLHSESLVFRGDRHSRNRGKWFISGGWWRFCVNLHKQKKLSRFREQEQGFSKPSYTGILSDI